jgi:hypothetical protein
MITINFIRNVTAEALFSKPARSGSCRQSVYFAAFARRMNRETRDKGEYGYASQALIALSSRMVDVLQS